jgi:hypothetical protein
MREALFMFRRNNGRLEILNRLFNEAHSVGFLLIRGDEQVNKLNAWRHDQEKNILHV